MKPPSLLHTCVLNHGSIEYGLFIQHESVSLMTQGVIVPLSCWVFWWATCDFFQFGHFFKNAKEKCKDPYPVEHYVNKCYYALDESSPIISHTLMLSNVSISPCTFCTFVITGWLNLITHLLLCLISLKLHTPVQFVMSVTCALWGVTQSIVKILRSL